MPHLPDALILCGGAGLRLKSVTGDAPKAMATVGRRPFLELLLRQLRRHGFERVILAVGLGQDMIRACFGEQAFGLNVVYSAESSPLGTGGALRNAASLAESDTALIMNGDSYTDVDLAEFIAEHRVAQANLSLVVTASDGRSDCGSVYVGPGGRVELFAEKQSPAAAACVSAGIYLAPWTLLHDITAGVPISLEHELFPKWLREGHYFNGFLCPNLCLDIGTPDRYRRAQETLAAVELDPVTPNWGG